MRKLFYMLIALVILISGNESYAQMNRRAIKKNNKRISSYRGQKTWFAKAKRYNAIGINISALNYYGDLAPRPNRISTDISFTRPSIGLSFTHRFGPLYSLTGMFMYGTLRGSDEQSADPEDTENGIYRSRRNLSFRNKIKELSVVATFDLFENQSTYLGRVKWTPYAFLGFGVFFHNPQAQAPAFQLDGTTSFPEAGQWVDLRPLGTEGQYSELLETDANHGIKPYGKVQPAIPFGIGARFRLNEVMDFSAEIGFRYTFTDYLDDVSQNYVDLGVFGNNELAKAMSYRSNETQEVKNNPALLRPEVARDNRVYNLIPGYGKEFPDNIRGFKNDRDVYMVTTLRVSYILGKTFHRAKFR